MTWQATKDRKDRIREPLEEGFQVDIPSCIQYTSSVPGAILFLLGSALSRCWCRVQ